MGSGDRTTGSPWTPCGLPDSPSPAVPAARQGPGGLWGPGTARLGLPGSRQAGPSSRAGRGALLLAAAAWIPSVEERVMDLACSAKCYHISSNFHFLWAGFQLSIFLPDARISQTFRSLRRSSVSQMRRRSAFRHPRQRGGGGDLLWPLRERRSRARRHSHLSGQ